MRPGFPGNVLFFSSLKEFRLCLQSFDRKNQESFHATKNHGKFKASYRKWFTKKEVTIFKSKINFKKQSRILTVIFSLRNGAT